MPLVSFIITYYNEPEAMLQACLESIKALPLAEDEAEIIVVDDGSEVPYSLLESCDVSYVRQEHAGLSVARNTGISQSNGRYIQFVDADDFLTSAYKAVLEQLREEKADIIMFKMTAKKKNISQVSCPELLSTTDFLLHHNLRAAAWGYAFKRDVLGDLQFYPGLFHEDELFTPQLFLRAKTLCDLNVKAYFYRQHEGTITHSNSLEKIQKRLSDIHFTLNELRKLDEPILERRIRQLTVDYLQKTWSLTHSFKELRCRTKELRREGFLPLPLRRYSLRYFLFSLFF